MALKKRNECRVSFVCKPMLSRVFIVILILSSFDHSICLAQQAFELEALQSPNRYKSNIEGQLKIIETAVFSEEPSENKVLLENGYAKYEFKNPDAWPPDQIGTYRPVAVRVIFTKYPRDSAFWLTDYQWLLSKRLTALFELDSNLNSTAIEYSILLQTDCDNEFETMQLFHGIEVSYEPIKETIDVTEIDADLSNTQTKNPLAVRKVTQFMRRDRYTMDSAVFSVLDRNTQWNNAVVVLDWTGSMYGHGAEAILWQALNEEQNRIRHCVFFNDGDRTKTRKKTIGYTKGIYFSETASITDPIKMMRRVQHKGNGGDSPENDLEALIATINKLPESQDIILVADNASCIRDFVLLQCLNRPIHVVLCRTKNGINPQYINLAWKTGGSLHFNDIDVHDLSEKMKFGSLDINGTKYVLTLNDVLQPVDRSDHFFAHCDRYYTYPKRLNRSKRRKEPECYFQD